MSYYTFIGSGDGQWNEQLLPPDVEGLWDYIKFYRALRDLGWDNELWLQTKAFEYGYDIEDWCPVKFSEMMATASADMLVGEPPNYSHGTDNDDTQARMMYILDKNQWASKFHTAATISASEGGVYLNAYSNPATPRGRDVPLFAVHSQGNVIPRFIGDELVACQVVHHYGYGQTVYRLFETQEPGVIRFELFQGTEDMLGIPVPLDDIVETASYPKEFATGVDRLMVQYVPNRRNGTDCLGRPDVEGVEPLIFAFFEALASGSRSFTAAEAKFQVDKRLIDPKTGKFPKGQNFFTLQKGGSSQHGDGDPVQQMQGQFDAGNTNPWLDELFDFGIMLTGFSPQSVGRNTSGTAESGTAKRFATAHTLLKISGKARYFAPAVEQVIQDAIYLDNKVIGAKPSGGVAGFNWPAEAITAPITIEFQDGLPDDELEKAQVIALNPDAYSVERKVTLLQSDLKGQDYTDEVKRIKDEAAAKAAVSSSPFQSILDNTIKPGGATDPNAP